MLRTRSGLPRSVARWTAQVAASLGATLVASLLYSVLPRPAFPEMPRPELTSGGKFAVRAVVPAALDGLDTMPLPHVAPRPVQLSVVEAPAALRRSADAVATPPVVPWDRATRPARSAHAPVKAEARRVAAAAEPVPRVLVAAPDAPAREEGFLHDMLPRVVPAVLPAVVSTARAAWTLTASAGESLVDRVVPQMP